MNNFSVVLMGQEKKKKIKDIEMSTNNTHLGLYPIGN